MTDDLDAYALDPYWLRRSFDRAAGTYDGAAVLQSQIREELLGRLSLMAISPEVVLDAGAGTGHGARALRRRYPKAAVIALDTSLAMLQVAGRRRSWLRGFGRDFNRVCADAARLPLPDASVDLIVSNLMLHWCDPDSVFAEFRRVLRPQGLLSFTTFGPDTLRELRSAWAQVDGYTHVMQFIDMHDLGDALVRAGFASPVLDVERYTLSYLDVRKVAEDLKATGAHNVTAGRPRGLVGRRRFARLLAAYETYRENERLPATYEVVFAHAWAPVGTSRAGGEQGAVVSLEEIKRQLRSRRG
jgi:malonyl-CoA O-methyltransferase